MDAEWIGSSAAPVTVSASPGASRVVNCRRHRPIASGYAVHALGHLNVGYACLAHGRWHRHDRRGCASRIFVRARRRLWRVRGRSGVAASVGRASRRLVWPATMMASSALRETPPRIRREVRRRSVARSPSTLVAVALASGADRDARVRPIVRQELSKLPRCSSACRRCWPCCRLLQHGTASVVGVPGRRDVVLFVSMLFLGEGILCVVMSAPLFYASRLVSHRDGRVARQRNHGGASDDRLRRVSLLVLVPMQPSRGHSAHHAQSGESVSATTDPAGARQMSSLARFVEPPRFDGHPDSICAPDFQRRSRCASSRTATRRAG